MRRPPTVRAYDDANQNTAQPRHDVADAATEHQRRRVRYGGYDAVAPARAGERTVLRRNIICAYSTPAFLMAKPKGILIVGADVNSVCLT